VASDLELGLMLSAFEDVAGAARTTEELGFDFAASGEHVSFHGPISNSLISLAVAAGATTRLKLLSAITLVPLYPVALLAKLTTALDVASNGRFHLGVGVGGENPREFEACGVPVRERGARTDEALEVLLRLWTEPEVTFDGRFTTLDRISIAPRPVQQPHPPVWVSGRSDAAMRRAARFGDAWMPYMYTPEMAASSYERIDAERDTPIRRALFIFFCVHHDGDAARAMVIERLSKQYAQDFSKLAGRYALAGTPDEVRTQVQRYLDAGATSVIFSSACRSSYRADNEHLLATEVLPAMRDVHPS
jgi:probable F420-dependent oxidoreductase